MTAFSAGILAYRRSSAGVLEVLLGHPGGPLWSHRDAGAWTIPKGLFETGESAEEAARREFAEETGTEYLGPLRDLGEVRQRSGKFVHVFAAEFDLDASAVESNLFEMEWPPRSGVLRSYPEIDRAEWFALDHARERIMPGQAAFLGRLEELLAE